MKFLTDADVVRLVSVEDAADAVERGFQSLAEDRAAVQSRSRTSSGVGKLSMLGAVLDEEMVAGAKVYTTAPDGTFCFAVLLFDPTAGRWLATIEAGELTRIRTSATSLMAARALARPDAEVLTVFGAGVQAASHALSFARAFPVTQVRVVNRRPAPDVVDMLEEKTGANVLQVDDPNLAVAMAGLVITATRSDTPLFSGAALDDGVHVTSVGATLPGSRELDDTTVQRASRVAVESREQARVEAGNLIGAGIEWDRVDELTDLASGRVPGRVDASEVTIFDSLGSGLEDVAVAALVYRRAIEAGWGTDLARGDVGTN